MGYLHQGHNHRLLKGRSVPLPPPAPPKPQPPQDQNDDATSSSTTSQRVDYWYDGHSDSSYFFDPMPSLLTMNELLGIGLLITFCFPWWIRNKKRQHRQRYDQIPDINNTPTHSQLLSQNQARAKKRRTQITNSSPSHSTCSTYSLDESSTDYGDLSLLDAKTFQRLRHQGIRFVGHGVHTSPQFVWLQLSPGCIHWETEYKQQNFTFSPQRKTIPWKEVLYLDVGKHTHAFQSFSKSSKCTIPVDCCFSLLTNRGTLDLQAPSQRERDSIVACLSHVLDTAHPHWRDLYNSETSSSSIMPAGSVAISDVFFTSESSGACKDDLYSDFAFVNGQIL